LRSSASTRSKRTTQRLPASVGTMPRACVRRWAVPVHPPAGRLPD
jgi:hypothetical protein